MRWFSDDRRIEDGTLPNVAADDAGRSVALRGYLRWLHHYLGDGVAEIDVFVLAPDCSLPFWNEIPDEHELQVEVVTFAER